MRKMVSGSSNCYTPAYDVLRVLARVLNQLNIFFKEHFIFDRRIIFKWNQTHKEQINERKKYIVCGSKLWKQPLK